MDIFIYERKCFQFVLADLPTWGLSLEPKLHPGGGFLDHHLLSLKSSHKDLSNEGSNFILSTLEVLDWVAQTQPIFNKLSEQGKILNLLSFELGHW